MEDGLWVILLEAGVALTLLLSIVWVSWPKEKQHDAEEPAPTQQQKRTAAQDLAGKADDGADGGAVQ